jgi:hydroxymethylpyrimidine pyrophosphatase-like HAD family hydrolase
VLALQDTAAAGVDYLVTENIPINQATAQWMAVTEATMKPVPSLSEHGHEHTVRVGIVAPADDMGKLKAELAEQFAGRMYTHSIYVESYGIEILEVFEPAVNKWEGILFVAGQHGVKAEEIIAVGDDVNDLPMIRNAGLGVAMGNARAEVKAAAKKIIGPNAHDGLAAFLNELVDRHSVRPEPKTGA